MSDSAVVQEIRELRDRVNKLWNQEVLSYIAWTDFGSTTVVGWSSYTRKAIYYKKIGTLVFVSFSIDGVSDSTDARFTLPYSNVIIVTIPIAAIDNSVQVSTAILYGTDDGVANFYPTIAGGNWTASNNKSVRGQFWYEVA